MRDRYRAGIGAPPGVQEEFALIAARAGAVGRALDPVPVLEVETRPRRGSCILLGPPSGSPSSTRALRVRLAAQLLEVAPSERAWTIAHELAHVLAAQEGASPTVPTGFLAGTIAMIATSVRRLTRRVPGEGHRCRPCEPPEVCHDGPVGLGARCCGAPGGGVGRRTGGYRSGLDPR